MIIYNFVPSNFHLSEKNENEMIETTAFKWQSNLGLHTLNVQRLNVNHYTLYETFGRRFDSKRRPELQALPTLMPVRIVSPHCLL